MEISAASTLLSHQIQGGQLRGGAPPDDGPKKSLDTDGASKIVTPLADDGKRGLLAEIQAMISTGESHNNIKSYAETVLEEHGNPPPGQRKGFLFDGRL
ncbi:MAG: hypothetical protein AAF962_06985 [Actinomycetota bacterium]